MPEIDGRVILLIVFVAISAIKWLMEKIQGGNQTNAEEEPAENVESLYEQYREEIRQRQTQLQKKPNPGTPPPMPGTVPPQRTQPQHRPPQPQRAQNQKRQQPAARPKPAPSFTPRKTVVSAEQRAAASRFEQHSSSQRRPSAQSYVRDLLSNPESTRQAIILSEILGKPKSVQGN